MNKYNTITPTYVFDGWNTNKLSSKCDFCTYDSPPSKRKPQCKNCTEFSNFILKNRMHPRQAYEWKQYELTEEFERGIKMSVKVCCDFCNKPLEFEYGRYIFHRARDVNIRALFPCLCENCAGKLNDICEILDVGSSKKAEVLEHNRKVNEERRVQLGTKG